jgi:hypothetical protein
VIATDLEYLLKEMVLEVPADAELGPFVLGQAEKLREEGRGLTILNIFACNPYWVDEVVFVLPNPSLKETNNKIEIEFDETLKRNEIKIVYYDPAEVAEF